MKRQNRHYWSETTNESIKLFVEAPMRINVPNDGKWSQTKINELWELVEGERLEEFGTLNAERLVRVSAGPLHYFFLLQKDKPVFVLYLERDTLLAAYRVNLAAKTTSKNSYYSLLKHLNRKYKMFFVSDATQTVGAEKVWKTIIKTKGSRYKFINDVDGQPLDVDISDVWGTSPKYGNVLIRVTKIA